MKESNDTIHMLLDNLKLNKFLSVIQMKRHVLNNITQNLSKEEILRIRDLFKSIDTNNYGITTFKQFKDGKFKYGSKFKEQNILKFMEVIDEDENGKIEFSKFMS